MRTSAPPRITASGGDTFYLEPGDGAREEGEAPSIPFTLRRGSRRRTHLAIRVGGEGEVEVLLPWRSGIPEALAAVQHRAGWIIRQVREARTRPRVAPYAYLPGEKHLYLGEALTLDILSPAATGVDSARAGRAPRSAGWHTVEKYDGQLQISLLNPTPDRVRKALDTWYRREATRIFAEHLERLCAGIHWLQAAPPLRLRAMRRRWGSCTRRGVLTLNTHLIKAPPRCIDYVLLHEIAHLREHNHSVHYYQVLKTLKPDWKEARRELESLAPVILRA